MKTDELIKALGRLKVQTGSLACLGCGHEDVSGAYVDKFHYEVNFLPEMIIPVTVTSHD